MRKILVLAIAIISVYSLSAEEGSFKTYSLKQAVEYGLQNNISAKNAKLSEAEATARNNELLSMGLPQINANFDYTYYIIRPLTPAISKIFNDPNSLTNQVYQNLALNGNNPGLLQLLSNYQTAHKNDKLYFVTPNNVSTGIALSQLVYDTRFFVGIKTFKSLVLLSQQTTALTEQEVKYNIMKGYYETQAAKEIIRVLDSNLVIVERLLHDTRETYKEGLIEETDVDRLELGESTLKSQINNTKNLFQLSLSSLKYYMGLQITDRIALTDDIESLRRQIPEVAPESFDPSQRIESQLLETSVKLHDFDRKQRIAGYYPSIYLMGNFGGGSQVSKVKDFFTKQDDGYGGRVSNWFLQSFVGFTIKIPIYDGGQKHASVKQANIQLQKSKNDLENFRNQSSLQVAAAKTTFTTNLIEEQNAKESMRLNTKIFNKTQVKFKEGVSSSFELILTEQDQTSNLIKYYTAVKNVLTSRAELDKALGIK